MPVKKTGLAMKEAVALLNNPEFCADSRSFWNQYRSHSQKMGGDLGKWKFQEEDFMRAHLDPFTKKWGIYPASDELLISPLWNETNSAQLSGQWGLIPVYQWTSKKEVTTRLKEIQGKIGKTHFDAKATRKAQIARWLENYQLDAQTGTRPGRSDIAEVVFDRKEGLRRPTTRQVIAGLSQEQEEALFQKCLQKVKDYKKAERLVHKSVRGSESRAAAAVRMSLQRYKQRQQSLKDRSFNASKTDKLARALTLLLRSIPPSKEFPFKMETICTYSNQLSRLLLPPESHS